MPNFTEANPPPTAGYVMLLLASLMARLIEVDVIDMQDAAEIEQMVLDDVRSRQPH